MAELKRDLLLVASALAVFLLAGRLLAQPAPPVQADALAAAAPPVPVVDTDLATARQQMEQLLSAFASGPVDSAWGRIQPYLSSDAQVRYPYVGQFLMVPRLRELQPTGWRLVSVSEDNGAIRAVVDIEYRDTERRPSTLRWGARLVRQEDGWAIQSLTLWSGSP